MYIYEPREDTELILSQLKNYAKGNILDIGTGTGILAIAAAKVNIFNHVIGVDINDEALECAKKQAEGLDNIQFIHSDLFEAFKGKEKKFDLVIFNPPYLPEEPEEDDDVKIALSGGKKGYEILERFFSEASPYLMPYGKILILFSTLTGREKVHEIIERYGFSYQKITEESFFQETLFVYLVEKSKFLLNLESKSMTNIEKLAKGHRGLIYTADLKGKKVAIKIKNPDSEAIGTILNEARWLKVLNMKGIGPELLFHEDEMFCYNYIHGIFIEKFFQLENKANIKKVIKDVFEQCFTLDSMQINKEEMHNPYKHVIVTQEKEPKSVLIDFERMHPSEDPKNVTQFCQYVSSAKVLKILRQKGFKIEKAKMISAAKRYKKQMNKGNLHGIFSIIR